MGKRSSWMDLLPPRPPTVTRGGGSRVAIILATAVVACALTVDTSLQGAANPPARIKIQPQSKPSIQPSPSNNTPTQSLTERVNKSFGLGASELIRLAVDLTPEKSFTTTITIDGRPYALQMSPHSVLSPQYQLRAQIADGSIITVAPSPERTLRGTLIGIPGSIVAGSMLPDGLHAMIVMPTKDEVWVEPIAARVAGADPDQYVVYRADNVVRDGGSCGVNDAWLQANPPLMEDGGLAGGGVAGLTQCAELACDADFEYYVAWGSNVLAVQNRITSIINTVNVQYEADLSIRHMITAIMVRTAEPDPYNFTDSTALLNEFRNEWLLNLSAIPRDVAQLFTGKDLDGTIIGLAKTTGAICTTNAYSLVQSDYNGSFSCATDLSAHELGHLWGADHCSCSSPAYTMNPNILCSNHHDPVNSIPAMIAHRDTRTCLSSCEDGTIALPFFDDFPSTTIDGVKWTGIDGAFSNTLGINEPSAPNSLNLDGSVAGGDQIRTAKINTTSLTNLTLTYTYQIAGDGDSPETNDDLLVEYYNSAGFWIEINRQLGSGADMTDFLPVTVNNFPADAKHSGFRLRFRVSQLSPSAGSDDWFVDDVGITATIPPGNDGCGSPVTTFAGSIGFSTIGATTDGPDEPAGCNFNGFTNITNDIWYRFAAQCTGTGTASLCGANFDAKVAVYGNPCPSGSGLTIGCNDDFCGSAPQVSFPVVTGSLYRIRVGGVSGATGTGVLVLSCAAPPPCPADITHNNKVDVDDLLAVINTWGACAVPPALCPADIAPPGGNQLVNVDDLLTVINAWGLCPP